MVSMLALSEVDCGFEHRAGQIKDYTIGICCFSAKNAALKRKNIDWLAQNQDIFSSGVTFLSAYYCFSDLALKKHQKACWSSTKQTSSSSQWNLTCSRHDIAEQIAELVVFNNNHSLIPKNVLFSFFIGEKCLQTNPLLKLWVGSTKPTF